MDDMTDLCMTALLQHTPYTKYQINEYVVLHNNYHDEAKIVNIDASNPEHIWYCLSFNNNVMVQWRLEDDW